MVPAIPWAGESTAWTIRLPTAHARRVTPARSDPVAQMEALVLPSQKEHRQTQLPRSLALFQDIISLILVLGAAVTTQCAWILVVRSRIVGRECALPTDGSMLGNRMDYAIIVLLYQSGNSPALALFSSQAPFAPGRLNRRDRLIAACSCSLVGPIQPSGRSVM